MVEYSTCEFPKRAYIAERASIRFFRCRLLRIDVAVGLTQGRVYTETPIHGAKCDLKLLAVWAWHLPVLVELGVRSRSI